MAARLTGHGDWPHCAQACRLVRCVQRLGKPVWQEGDYAVTRLTLAQAGPPRLLPLWHQHWHSEHRLHCVRDATLGEDRCHVRTRPAPLVRAGLRNTVISLLRMADQDNIAAALRRRAVHPEEALRLLLPPLDSRMQ